MALDILYAEGQRRYIESLSSYARQFLGVPQRPDVDKIEGLCPAVAIDQKTVGHNPRSTVGKITEIYDYLRVLLPGLVLCSVISVTYRINSATFTEIVGLIRASYADKYVTIVAPVVQDKKGNLSTILSGGTTRDTIGLLLMADRYNFRPEVTPKPWI